jgi:hypothetical protein
VVVTKKYLGRSSSVLNKKLVEEEENEEEQLYIKTLRIRPRKIM